MSQLRSKPMTGGAYGRRASGSAADRRATCTTTPPQPPNATHSYSRRVASVTTNYRDRPNGPPRPQSSERPIAAKKTPTNPPVRTDHPPRQLFSQGFTGNRQSLRNPNKRPPFVVGTGNSTAYRAYSTTKTESRSRSNATSSKDRRPANTGTGSVPKDSGTTGKSERPAARATETTLISSNICDAVRQSREAPDLRESSATIIVADPLPEVFLHRPSRKQHHPSADECIKQVAEKLSEFAAIQNNASSDAAKSGSITAVNCRQQPTTGNDVTKEIRRCDATESPQPPPLTKDDHSLTAEGATISGGNDVSSALTKRVGGTSKKAAEVHRSGSMRLSAACRPSPTRSSLLRQALNCPGSAASQRQRPPRAPPTRTVERTHRSATELGKENHSHIQASPQRQQPSKRVNVAQTSRHTAALTRNSKQHQTSQRFDGDHHVGKCAADSKSAAVMRELRDPATTTTRRARQKSVDAASTRTYDVNGGSSSQSSLSTPRTYVVDVLAETDDESSRQTSPRISGRLARRCRRRRPQSLEDDPHNNRLPVQSRQRPQSLDDDQHSRLPESTTTNDGRPEVVGHLSHQSSSTEKFVEKKLVSLSSESMQRQRRRRSPTTSPSRATTTAAVVVSSVPNLPKVQQPRRRRSCSVSSEGEDGMSPRRCAESSPSVEVQIPRREDAEAKWNVCDQHRASRLPRLVSAPHETLPSTSSVSTSVHAPRPRSFRYSRLHRRAVDALVPPQLRDMPWRWAWKVNTSHVD